MNFKTEEILNLIERSSGIPDLLSRKEELEAIIRKFENVEEYLKRFNSLEELTDHFKMMEDKIYVCKTYLTTNEAVKYLSMSKFTILEAVKRHELPYYTPPSKCFYFAKEDLDNWVRSFRVPSRKEMEENMMKELQKPTGRRR